MGEQGREVRSISSHLSFKMQRKNAVRSVAIQGGAFLAMVPARSPVRGRTGRAAVRITGTRFALTGIYAAGRVYFRHQVMAPGTGGIMKLRESLEPGLERQGPRLLLIQPRPHRLPSALSQQTCAEERHVAAQEAQRPTFQFHRGNLTGPLGSSVHTPSNQLWGGVTLHERGSWCREGGIRGITPRNVCHFTLISRWCASHCEKYLSSSVLSLPLKYPDIFHLSSLSLAHNHLALEADNKKGCPRKYLLGHQDIEHLFPVLVDLKQQS